MPMRCHYEVLCLSKDATDDDIKKSYRKLALKWHPDKNPDRIDEVTKEFHLIQQAYDVLIDPQERAWYDRHREAILRGGLGKGGDYEDDSLDVYQYFNTTCFTGYGDDENGFYAVYQEVFKKISKEDLEYMDDVESDWEAPDFGNTKSSYEEVVHPFYSHWGSYCTVKSYVWAEKYDTREAPNRQIRRLMEQDNKKLRDKAKKERNEEVRALTAFVRKRDKRVQAQKKKLEERAAEVARLTKERQVKEKKERLKNMEEYEETGWSATSALERDLAQLEASVANEFGEAGREGASGGSERGSEEEEEEKEEVYYDDLFCVACNKSFKTEKSFANHEKSKKHKENVSFLRAHMQEEDRMLDDLDLGLGDPGEVEEEPTGAKPKLSKKQKKRRKQQQQAQKAEDSEEEEGIAQSEEGLAQSEEGLAQSVEDLHLNDATAKTHEESERSEETTISPQKAVDITFSVITYTRSTTCLTPVDCFCFKYTCYEKVIYIQSCIV